MHDFWFICPRSQFIALNGEVCNGKKSSLSCSVCAGRRTDFRVEYFAFLQFLLLAGAPLINLMERHSVLDQYEKINNLYLYFRRKRKMEETLDEIDFLITRTKYTTERVLKTVKKKSKIIYSAPSAPYKSSKFNSNHSSLKTPIRFGFIGRITSDKGLGTLIKAFNLLKGQPATLDIYGDVKATPYSFAYYKSLKEMMRNKRVRFQGSFKREDIRKVYDKIDVLVIPSIRTENSPLVITEAFSFKKPVITSDIDSISEMLHENINCLRFKSGDHHDLYQKMKVLIEKPSLIEKLSSNIPEIRPLSVEADEHIKLYQAAIKQNFNHP